MSIHPNRQLVALLLPAARSAALLTTWAIEEVGVPDDLRVTAFEKGFEALVGSAGVPAVATTSAVAPATPLAVDGGRSLESIAVKLGLDHELAQEIYYVDEESSLGLAVAASKFPV